VIALSVVSPSQVSLIAFSVARFVLPSGLLAIEGLAFLIDYKPYRLILIWAV
jgi:hypothetical protein